MNVGSRWQAVRITSGLLRDRRKYFPVGSLGDILSPSVPKKPTRASDRGYAVAFMNIRREWFATMNESRESKPIPTELTLRKKGRVLGVTFSNGLSREVTAEYLRVHSPSAEVTGHGVGEGVLVTGKERVAISSIEPVGQYAVRLVFDDGHDTGLYTWPLLYELCSEHDAKWQRHLDRLAELGQRRDSSADDEL